MDTVWKRLVRLCVVEQIMRIVLMIHRFDRLRNQIRTFPFVKKLGQPRSQLGGGIYRNIVSDSGKGGWSWTDY